MSEWGPREWRCGDYVISDDPERFDADAMHDFLEVEAYWAQGRSREETAVAAANSLVLGLYGPDGSMVGGARIVTDRAVFGYLSDLYVLAKHRGLGLGRALAAAACEHPAVAGIKRLLLITADAHELYRPLGFTELPGSERWMELCPVPSGPPGNAGAGEGPAGADAVDGGEGGGGAAGADRFAGTDDIGTGGGRDGAAGADAVGAGEGEDAAGGDGAPGLVYDPAVGPRPYAAWQGGGLPDPRTAPVAQVVTHLLEIVGAEGPVTADRAYRLYIRGAGSSKVTQRARAPMEQALGRLTLRRQVTIDEFDNSDEPQQVLRVAGTPPVVVRELGERSLYEVPLNEVAELMTHKRQELLGRAGAGTGTGEQPAHAVADVIRQAALRRASPERIKRAVLDAYGLIRMTQAAEQYLDAALALHDAGEH